MHDRPKRFFVVISGDAYVTLVNLAREQRRTYQDQAAVLLEEILDLDQEVTDGIAQFREGDPLEFARAHGTEER